MSAKKDRDETIIIKKYANRRLYNTSTSSYVTLDHLCQMVKDGIDFTVHDAKTGEDITRSVLTQIIVEEEAKGEHLLPIGFLRQIIGFYGDNMKGMMIPQYLEHSMKTFAENQDQLQSYFQETMGKIFPFGSLDEIGKQNLAMLQQTLKMFSTTDKKTASEEYKNRGKNSENEEVYELRKRLDEMQRQINKMTE
ncbi:MAG: polyhydroxyalkanoate synthesis repressor PhaR [Pseudomonadota bacterium]|nr:polyhydroxyalkanoate synthesis repressor PhaR [Pseudomonadota bacterium]